MGRNIPLKVVHSRTDYTKGRGHRNRNGGVLEKAPTVSVSGNPRSSWVKENSVHFRRRLTFST